MKIPSLLNPQPEQPLLTLPSSPYSWQSDKATPKECSKAKSVALSPRLKQDLGVSDYNYKRFKPNSAQQRADMQDFDVKPIDDPHPSPRSIPYSSDKKGLKEKTGMDGFSGKRLTFLPVPRSHPTSARIQLPVFREWTTQCPRQSQNLGL